MREPMTNAAKALADHLNYGGVEQRTTGDTGERLWVLVLDENECAELLYELTDDKRWLQ